MILILLLRGVGIVNASQDFTDKYVKCCECGKYIPLGDITNSLPENMTCNHSTRGHSIAYLDTNIYGVMDYEKVVYYINNPENVTAYTEINEDVSKILGVGTGMESSLIVRQDFDYIIYDHGLWDEEIPNDYIATTPHHSISEDIRPINTVIKPITLENQNSEDI